MADAAETRALLLQIQANTELLRSNLTAAERAVKDFADKTQHHLDDGDKRFELFGKSIERLEGPLEHLKAMGETAFAFLLGESLIEKGKEALEFAGNIEFAAQKIGVTTTFLQQFRYAASQSGASIEDTDAALTKFSRSVGEAANGNKAVIKLFNDLGVSVLDSGGKVRSVEGVYRDTATAISKIPDPARRTADTLTLMGRGASALIPLMAKGAEGFNQLADAANQLGIVLSPDLIEHSEEVNHKMAALKLILDAQMASAVAQNAEAIESIASALVKAAGAVAKFLGADPARALALMGAMAGGRALGGPGVVIGAVAGAAIGEHLNDTNDDLEFRARQLHAAAERVRRDQRAQAPGLFGGLVSVRHEGDASQNDLAQAWHDLRIEQDRYRRALAANKGRGEEGHPGLGSDGEGASNPDISHHKKGKSAEQLAREAEAKRQRELSEDEAYYAELRAAQTRYQKAEAALADTAENQLRAELAGLQNALIDQRQRIDDQFSAGKITQARRDELVRILEATEQDEEDLARRKRDSRVIAEKAAKDQLALQGQIDMLGLDDRLAYTRRERLKIELQILELQRQQAIREQQKIIDDPLSNKAQRDDARTRQGQINDQFGRQQEDVRRQNAAPMDAFRDQLKRDTADMNDALQSVEVDGLKSLQDGLLSVISGTESLGSAFKKMADQIIADLIRIGIEKMILAAIGGGSGGSGIGGIDPSSGDLIVTGHGGSGGSLWGSIASGLGHMLGFAGGGDPPVGVPSIVGENGPEIFVPRQPGTIIPNGGLRAPSIPSLAGTGGSNVLSVSMPIHIDATGADAEKLGRVEQKLDQMQREFPGQVVRVMTEAKGRGVLRGVF